MVRSHLLSLVLLGGIAQSGERQTEGCFARAEKKKRLGKERYKKAQASRNLKVGGSIPPSLTCFDIRGNSSVGRASD